MNRLILCLTVLLTPALAIASSLPTLKYRAMTTSGTPMSGAKLCFYATGGTTPLATYSDEALTVANSNPVIADSYGWFGEIYLKTDSAYRVVLMSAGTTTTCATGTTQWTLNGVRATQLTSTSIESRINQIASNPLYYGAVGDGVADESSDIQEAIDHATGVVDLLGKVYRCDSAITVPSGITIKNGTLDFSAASASSSITLTGVAISSNLLTSDSHTGDTHVDSTAVFGIQAGDWVLIKDDSTYVTGITPAELKQVSSLASLVVNTTTPLGWNYHTANTSIMYNLETVSGVVFDNVNMIHSASATNKSLVAMKYASNITFRNCSFDGASLYDLWIDDSSDIVIDRCEFSDNKSTATGIFIDGASSEIKINNSRFSEDGTNGILISGDPVRAVTISDCIFSGPTYGVTLGKSSDSVTIDRCDFQSGTTGVYGAAGSSSSNLLIKNSRINTTTAIGISGALYPAVTSPSSFSSVNISANELSSGISISCGSGNTGGISPVFSGNNIKSGNIAFACVSGTGEVEGVSIKDNNLYSGCISSQGDGAPVHGVANIYGNNLYSTTCTTGILVEYPYRAQILGNKVAGDSTTTIHGIWIASPVSETNVDNNIVTGLIGGGSGVYIQESPSTRVSNNNISTLEDAIEIENSTAVWDGLVISGNRIAFTTGNGIYVNSTSVTSGQASITGNTVESWGTAATDYTVNIYGEAYNINISGNALYKENDACENILLSGSAAGHINYVNVVGNTFYNGNYAIGEGTDANTTNVFASGNLLNGVSTSIAEYGVTLGKNVPDYQSSYQFDVSVPVVGTAVFASGAVITLYPAELYDSGSVFNVTTGLFTAPVDGTYTFSYSLLATTTCSAGDANSESTIAAYLQVTGLSSRAVSQATTPETDAESPRLQYLSGSATIKLSATNTVGLFVLQTESDGGADCDTEITATPNYGNFQGTIVTVVQ